MKAKVTFFLYNTITQHLISATKASFLHVTSHIITCRYKMTILQEDSRRYWLGVRWFPCYLCPGQARGESTQWCGCNKS